MITLKKSLLFASSLFLIAMGPVSAHPPAKESSKFVALQAVDQVWLRAYNAGDANKVASLYAKDAVLLPPGAPV